MGAIPHAKADIIVINNSYALQFFPNWCKLD
jgi:hypothetical protein